MSWVLLSIVLVWAYMTFHVKSFFLGFMAIFQILLSFPISVVIYQWVFRITFYSILQNLVVFVVLGVAADNIFVFTDAWRQSGRERVIRKDLVKRMNFTWRRAAKAMLVTSSTTAFAFLSSGFSALMPIKSFGYFAAIIIPMNFLLVIALYPALIIVEERIVKKINAKIFFCRKKKEADQEEDFNDNDVEERPENGSSKRIHKDPKPSLLERFFGGPWNWFINKSKWILFIMIIIWSGFAIWRATLMGALTKSEQWLPDSHFMQ